jgi:sulfate permease, SulP family
MTHVLQILRSNWKSGVTVALVSVPLSVSLAIAANATPVMGIITAIWAGLIASIFGGSKYNILGPAAALSGVLASYVLVHGIESLPWITVGTGILVLIAWALHWEKYIAFIPGSVVHGFTLAVALIIGLNQINFAVGLSGLEQHQEFVFNVWESLTHLGQSHLPTVAVFLAGLAFLFAWHRFVPTLPGPIPLALLGIGLGMASARGMGVDGLQTLFTKFGDFDTAIIRMPSFSWSMINRAFVSTTLTVALIAMLETLLSAKVADGMTRTKFNRRKEMLGLGLANLVCGLAGGLPATGVFARTAINVKSGATHRISQGINAIAVAIICLLFLTQFRYLPLSIVAAILVFSATRMVHHEHFARLYRNDRAGFWLSMAVAALSVAFDPMIGILIGATAALLFFVHAMSKGQAEVTINKEGALTGRMSSASFARAKPAQGDVFVYRFAGPLTYVNAQAHLATLERLTDPHTVVLAFRNLFFIDVDGVDAIEDIVESLEAKDMRVAFSGIGELLVPMLSTSQVYERKKRQGLIFDSTSVAVKALAEKEGNE